jgi:hypothetical protein
MPKRIRKLRRKKKRQDRPADVNRWAHAIGNESTNTESEKILPSPTDKEISRLMAAMGRRGGKIGGKRRMETMTPEQRSQSALKAAQARWKKNPES